MGLVSQLSLANHFDSEFFLVVHALFSQDGCQRQGFWEVVRYVVPPFDLSWTLPVGGGLLVSCSLLGPPVIKQLCKWLLWCLARVDGFNQCVSPNNSISEFSMSLTVWNVLMKYFMTCHLIQFSSVHSLSHVQLCDPMNRSTPGLPVHHQLPEFTQTHVHRVSDAIQPSHPLLPPSPPAPYPSQHQSPFQGVNSSHEVAKVLEFQL